jgi:putative oxidoreductase
MKSLLRSLSQLSSVSVAIVRIIMGTILVYAGYLKVFHQGWFIENLRNTYKIPISELFGPLISVLELVGGALLIVGLFTRILGVLYTIEFLVASVIVMGMKGVPFAFTEKLLLVGAFLLATHGAGTLSLDRPGQRWEP